MADLIAIGYPDETTAFTAADEARRLAADLIIQPQTSGSWNPQGLQIWQSHPEGNLKINYK